MDIEKLTEIIDSQGKQIELLIEKYNELEKKMKDSPKQNRQIVKNIPFEEAFLKCEKATEGEGSYPCMYLPKSGKNKGNCCGSEAVFVDDKEGEQLRIKDTVNKEFYHTLRCNTCRTRGRANSESKKKCMEKIKGINISKPGEVNESALSFLSGVSNDVISPSRAIKDKHFPEGDDIEYDNYFHFIVKYDGNSYIFERSKNKSGSPCMKKTPILRGYIDDEDVDEENYTEKLKTSIPEDLLEEIQKKKKFKFEGNVLSSKKSPVVPQMNFEEDSDNEDIKNVEEKKFTDVDDILDGLDVE